MGGKLLEADLCTLSGLQGTQVVASVESADEEACLATNLVHAGWAQASWERKRSRLASTYLLKVILHLLDEVYRP